MLDKTRKMIYNYCKWIAAKPILALAITDRALMIFFVKFAGG